MGNLLGAPITTKETHIGQTLDEHSLDSGGLQFGVSSMQGWRVHMEDAHIALPFLYAEKKLQRLNDDDDDDGEELNRSGEGGSIEISLSNDPADGAAVTTQVNNTANNNSNSSNTTNNKKYQQLPLPNHSLFAVFDGHGGAFAAQYAARNLPRVLSRQAKFVEYAELWRGREDYLRGVEDRLTLELTAEEEECCDDHEEEEKEHGVDNVAGITEEKDRLRLQQLKQRGRQSDENVKKIKERVRRHLGSSTSNNNNSNNNCNTNNAVGSTDGSSTTATIDQGQDDNETTTRNHASSSSLTISTSTSTNNNNNNFQLPTTPQNNTNALQIATAAYDHNLMTLLESSLRDALCDLDKEIYEEVIGVICGGTAATASTMVNGTGSSAEEKEERNVEYGVGYPFNDGHGDDQSEKSGGNDDQLDETTHSSTSSSSDSHAPQHQTPTPTPIDDEDSGTTASIVLLTPRWIVCANAGDSRAVYSRSNHRVVALSYDHKPDDEEEERRIREAGGYVSAGRVEGDLAVSRGLGDFRFKEEQAVMSGAEGENRRIGSGNSSNCSTGNGAMRSCGGGSRMLKPSEQKVSPVPNIIVQNRDRAEDEFMIIACDGIWDVQTNQECVKMVADIFNEGEQDLGLICEEMLDLCLMKGSKDNMTAVVVKFPKQLVGQGGGVMARRERRAAMESQEAHSTYTVR